MFRTLRQRLTLLYAGATLILLSIVAIGMMWWLNQQFTQAADEALYMRMTRELEERDLPIPTALINYYKLYEADDDQLYDLTIDTLTPYLPSQTPIYIASSASSPSATSTFVIAVNEQGIAIRDKLGIPPIPLNYDSLIGTLRGSNFDVRTITDDKGNQIRILSYHVQQDDVHYLQVGRPMTDYLLLQSQIYGTISLIFLIIVIGVSVLAWVLSGYLVAPTERAYEQQQNFITHASHELRTPLSIIRSSAEVAQLDLEPNHPVAPLIADIIDENRHMSTILDNLLTMTRIQSIAKTVPPYDLAPIIDQIVATMHHRHPHRQISHTLTLDTYISTSDYSYIRHIIQILIDNAIAHTDETCTIQIHAHKNKNGIQLSVCDDGPGIPADQVSQIFQPFVTIRRGTNHRGSGVGLSMAQAFSKALHAKLSYHDNKPHGACFRLSLHA
ncbi:MAG: sensor histidine kinase [Roseiflexaceae bacterium]